MTQINGKIIQIDGRDRRPWAVISREKLLEAAVAEIADRGYENARLVDIAARADLTVGSVYTWFKNKSDLFNAALEYAITTQQERNQVQLESEETLKGQAHWILMIGSLAPRHGATDSGPTPAQKLLIEALKAAWRDEDSRDVIMPQIAGLLTQYENTVRQGIAEGSIASDLDAQLLARLFMAFPIGLSMLTLAGLPDPNPASFIPFFQRFGETLKPRS